MVVVVVVVTGHVGHLALPFPNPQTLNPKPIDGFVCQAWGAGREAFPPHPGTSLSGASFRAQRSPEAPKRG